MNKISAILLFFLIFFLFFLFFLLFSSFFSLFICFFFLLFSLQVYDKDGLYEKMGLQLKALEARPLRRCLYTLVSLYVRL